MANLVIDASVSAAWCFADEQTAYTNGVLQSLPSVTAFAPRLWEYEIRNSVLTGFRRGRISQADAEAYLSALWPLNIQLSDPVSYDAVFRLAHASGLSVYDASYLDLAMREGAQLASLDDALRSAAVKAGVVLFNIQPDR